MSAESIERVLSRLNPELWLVTAAADGRCGGLIATFVTRAAIVAEAPRVAAGFAVRHHTWELIEASGRFCAHLLPQDAADLVIRFGTRSGHAVDKFADFTAALSPGGCPLVQEALSWLDCRVEARLPTGDRTIYLAEVTAGEVLREGEPLQLSDLPGLLPPETLALMEAQYRRDAEADAAAIAARRKASA